MDTAGMVILTACASWSLITAAARDGRPGGVLLAVPAAASGYAAEHWRRLPRPVRRRRPGSP
ncbi:hypothetical protein [Streptomyces sp. E5N298]|uniref:hypothetical protein n=1 Tax=Streptomyces sp. E5N298 TaxID=1851983 RepID=UPI001EE8F615|nr:hypothetical protein [Streptomyces sp. E5N298]